MDTLRDRLAALADDAPTGGAPAAELWARGIHARRVRATAIVAALVAAAAGTGVGVRLADGGHDRSDLAPARTVGFALPIDYPAGAALPGLGDTPGPLAAVWLVPRDGGGSPHAVGLVAKTGKFGMLPIDLPSDDPQAPENLRVALSPDGRRVAYPSRTALGVGPDAGPATAVLDLVSGKTHVWNFDFDTRGVGLWVDATHLFGYVAAGSDGDGFLWQPGKKPTRVNPYLVPYAGSDVAAASWPALQPPMISEDGSGSCTTLSVEDARDSESPPANVPTLCTILGVIGPDILLGHRKDATDGDATVVAVEFDAAPRFCPSPLHRCTLSVDDAHRRVVATAGAPGRVTFATDLIGVALTRGGRS